MVLLNRIGTQQNLACNGKLTVPSALLAIEKLQGKKRPDLWERRYSGGMSCISRPLVESGNTQPRHALPMKTNPLKQGVLTENSVGIGTVSHEMVRRRAAELALINGHSTEELTSADLEQAERELTGKPEVDPEQEILESALGLELWDPMAGSVGHKVQENFSEDEDGDGRSDSAQLVQQGIDEAEHDQMLQAAKAKAAENKN
jgi:hypothetical protein